MAATTTPRTTATSSNDTKKPTKIPSTTSQQPSSLFHSLLIILPIVIAGIYGYIRQQQQQKHDSDRGFWNYSTWYNLFITFYEIIQQHPLLADNILVNWWNGWIQSFTGTLHHSYTATGHFIVFLYLTIMPLTYIVYYCLVRLLLYHILYQTLIQQILLSPTAVNQVKSVIYDLIAYQRSLSWKQVGMEVVVVLLCFLLRQTYGFLKRQTYIQRTKLWYRRKKLNVIKSYRNGIERIAKVSSLVATMTPHALFVATVSIVKFFLPSVLSWIACETALTNILHWYYPVIAGIWLIQDIRDDERLSLTNDEDNKMEQQRSSTSVTTSSSKPPSSEDVPVATKRISSFWPRTQPQPTAGESGTTRKETLRQQHANTRSVTKGGPSSRLLAPTKVSAARDSETRKKQQEKKKVRSTVLSSPMKSHPKSGTSPQGTSVPDDDNNSTNLVENTVESRTQFWLQYWTIVAAVACFKRILYLLPIVSRAFSRSRTLSSTFQQLELIFWIWLNVMPAVTPSSTMTGKNQQRPLLDHLSTVWIQPFFRKSYQSISAVVSVDTWDSYVVQNASKLMIPLVWAKFLSQDRADTLIHLLKEFRVMVVPSALVLSWPVSSYGVAYAQYGLPLAISGRRSKEMIPKTATSKEDIHWLQFWVLHTLLAGIIHKFDRLLWFIPFSNVAVFGAFAFLALVHGPAIASLYDNMIQKELQAFGLLHSSVVRSSSDDDDVPSIEETKIVRMVHWFISRLPSAGDATSEEEEEETESDNGRRNQRDDNFLEMIENELIDPDTDEADTPAGKVQTSISDSNIYTMVEQHHIIDDDNDEDKGNNNMDVISLNDDEEGVANDDESDDDDYCSNDDVTKSDHSADGPRRRSNRIWAKGAAKS